ncbi:hypothetical protein [Fulvivirga maritima]|nr:hypothetical protein [Fulvivirga maritima]
MWIDQDFNVDNLFNVDIYIGIVNEEQAFYVNEMKTFMQLTINW